MSAPVLFLICALGGCCGVFLAGFVIFAALHKANDPDKELGREIANATLVHFSVNKVYVERMLKNERERLDMMKEQGETLEFINSNLSRLANRTKEE